MVCIAPLWQQLKQLVQWHGSSCKLNSECMQLLAQTDLAQSCGRMDGPLCNSNPLGWKLSDRCPHSTFSLL